MPKSKSYEAQIDPSLADEILRIPMDTSDGPPARTIGERVQRAIAAVDEANRHLAESRAASIIAQFLMQQLRRRGVPSLHVTYSGQVVLRIRPVGSSDETTVKPSRRKDAPDVMSKVRQGLPYMPELREWAARLGVDIEDLGQARRAIFDRLTAAEKGLPTDQELDVDDLLGGDE